MLETQISDLWVFYNKALTHPVLVYCCCVPSSRVESNEGFEVRLTPTLNLDYRIEFPDKLWGDWCRWTFLEVRPADDQGIVSLEGTLLSRLRAHDPKSVVIEHRSGSISV